MPFGRPVQKQSRWKKERTKLSGNLILALMVSLFLLFTGTASGDYQSEDPPVITSTTTEPVVTDEPGTEEPSGDQNPATEPVANHPPAEAETLPNKIEEETVEILVGLAENKIPDGLVPEHVTSDSKAWSFSENNELEKLNIIVLNVPASKAMEEMQRLQNLPGVAYAEPNYLLQGLDTIPNDPGFSSQYALTAIRAPQGWDISTGSAAVTIAIVDSGVDYGHVELASKLVAGYDFVNNDSIADDQNGHGTHVAGIAAASSNNGVGVAGVSWGARIMPVRVLDAGNSGTVDDIAAGIIWAADNGAQIINLSLGGSNPSNTLENAVNYAAGMGVLLIGAAGNGGSNQVFYPARYPAVMAVAATDASNQRALTSNYGPEVDIAAPGDLIYSLDIGGYTTRTGTSMAASHVSGLASVLWGQAGQGSAANVRWSIESTALDIALPGWDPYTGAGLIQMDAALGAPPLPTATFTASATFLPTMGPILNDSPAQGYAFSQPGEIVTWTPPSKAEVSFTPTFTLTPTPSATSISIPTTTQNMLTTPTPEAEMSGQEETPNKWWDRLSVFLSPLFCGGILLLLLGIFWAWMIRQRQQTKYTVTVKFGSSRTGFYK